MLTMATLQRLWKASPPLTATGLLMLAVFAASLVAMAVDTSTILGAPRWLKPAKFAISTAIYAFTLAWIFTYLPNRRGLTRPLPPQSAAAAPPRRLDPRRGGDPGSGDYRSAGGARHDQPLQRRDDG